MSRSHEGRWQYSTFRADGSFYKDGQPHDRDRWPEYAKEWGLDAILYRKAYDNTEQEPSE